jgi:hypothetical protein
MFTPIDSPREDVMSCHKFYLMTFRTFTVFISWLFCHDALSCLDLHQSLDSYVHQCSYRKTPYGTYIQLVCMCHCRQGDVHLGQNSLVVSMVYCTTHSSLVPSCGAPFQKTVVLYIALQSQDLTYFANGFL